MANREKGVNPLRVHIYMKIWVNSLSTLSQIVKKFFVSADAEGRVKPEKRKK